MVMGVGGGKDLGGQWHSSGLHAVLSSEPDADAAISGCTVSASPRTGNDGEMRPRCAGLTTEE